MRCQNCNKFTALNFEDPEVQTGPDLDNGTITEEVRIYRTSECCGEEMKEATLNLEAEVPQDILDAHEGDGHELEVDADDPEQVEEGGGRYAKSYFGARVHFLIRCSCQKEGEDALYEGEMEDKVSASEMDEMC